MAQCGQGVCGFSALCDGDNQGVRICNRLAVAVFTRDLYMARDFGDGFNPILRDTTTVVTGTTRENEHAVNVFECLLCIFSKQLGGDAFYTFQGVSNSTRLLKNFFLHVVAIRPQLCCAAVCVDGFDFACHSFRAAVIHGVLA